MSKRHVFVGVLLVAGAGLIFKALSYSWGGYKGHGGTGGLLLSADIDHALMFGAAVIAILGIWRAVRPGQVIDAVSELAATILAAMVVGALLMTGDWSAWPETGAWLAGGAVAVLGSAAVVSRNPSRLTVTLALCLSITAVAACAVAVPPTHLTNPDPIHVIP